MPHETPADVAVAESTAPLDVDVDFEFDDPEPTTTVVDVADVKRAVGAAALDGLEPDKALEVGVVESFEEIPVDGLETSGEHGEVALTEAVEGEGYHLDEAGYDEFEPEDQEDLTQLGHDAYTNSADELLVGEASGDIVGATGLEATDLESEQHQEVAGESNGLAVAQLEGVTEREVDGVVDEGEERYEDEDEEGAEETGEGEYADDSPEYGGTQHSNAVDADEDEYGAPSEDDDFDIVVIYDDEEYLLFCNDEGDDPNTYFLTDRVELRYPLSTLLASIRSVIKDDVAEGKQIVLSIESLDIEIPEEASPKFLETTTFSDIVAVYRKLANNDELTADTTMYIKLLIRGTTAERFDDLRRFAAAGGSLADLAQTEPLPPGNDGSDSSERPSHAAADGEDEEPHDEADWHAGLNAASEIAIAAEVNHSAETDEWHQADNSPVQDDEHDEEDAIDLVDDDEPTVGAEALHPSDGAAHQEFDTTGAHVEDEAGAHEDGDQYDAQDDSNTVRGHGDAGTADAAQAEFEVEIDGNFEDDDFGEEGGAGDAAAYAATPGVVDEEFAEEATPEELPSQATSVTAPIGKDQHDYGAIEGLENGNTVVSLGEELLEAEHNPEDAEDEIHWDDPVEDISAKDEASASVGQLGSGVKRPREEEEEHVAMSETNDFKRRRSS